MHAIAKSLFALTTVAVLALPLSIRAEDKPAARVKSYSLETCIVTDEKLGEMGKPFVLTNGTQEIKLCCKSCKKKFDKDPATYMKKLADAETKAKAKK